MPDPGPRRLAVDIGGTTTRVALVEGMTLRERREMPTRAQDGPDTLIQRLLDLVGEVCPRPGFQTVGVACTGRVQGGHVTAVNAATMPGWTDIPLRDTLSSVLGAPVQVINDARAATLGEWRARASSAAENFMFVTVSTGIGSGLILGGRLHDPPGGRDVGLGFTRGPNGDALEHGSSGSGLQCAAQAGGYPSVAALFDAAEDGDAQARRLLHAPFTALADRLWDAHCLLGLHTICLGGSVGLRVYTGAFLAGVFKGPDAPVIQAAQLGADAGLIGAALFAGL